MDIDFGIPRVETEVRTGQKDAVPFTVAAGMQGYDTQGREADYDHMYWVERSSKGH